MSIAASSLAADLAPSGSLAWQRLHGDISSQLMVDVKGSDGKQERVAMAFADLLAFSSSDPDTRPGTATCLLKGSPYIDYHLYRMYDSAATNVPATQQRTGYSNPEVDKLIAAERSTFDPEKRLPILKQVQQIIWQDQPIIYLLQLVNIWGARQGTSGFIVLPTGDFVPHQLQRGP